MTINITVSNYLVKRQKSLVNHLFLNDLVRLHKLQCPVIDLVQNGPQPSVQMTFLPGLKVRSSPI